MASKLEMTPNLMETMGTQAADCGVILERDEATAESVNLFIQYEIEDPVQQAELIPAFWRGCLVGLARWEEALCFECGGTVQPEYHPGTRPCNCRGGSPMWGMALDLVSGGIVFPEGRG